MKKERINEVINEVVSLGLDLTVENVYAQSLFSPGGTLFNCDEEVKRQIYLHKELIPNVEYVINDNKVQITSPSTNYINITRHKKISLDSILSMTNEMDKMRKADKRIKVRGISTIRKRVKDAYKLYLIDWEVYNEAFNKCIVLAKQVEREGLHYGTSDDSVLKALNEERFIIERLGYGGTNYSTMLELNNSIKGVLNACRMIGTDCLKMEVGI